jgi:hypothetical protein
MKDSLIFVFIVFRLRRSYGGLAEAWRRRSCIDRRVHRVQVPQRSHRIESCRTPRGAGSDRRHCSRSAVTDA